jgi:cleavage and polyadenylation specificity factor subunit 3
MAAPHGRKRPATDAPTFERLEFMPLGGGEEVGRSCLILRYKGKTIMLDCGVLPGFQNLACLPLLDAIDPAEIDIVFITHFHLDHAAALPYFTQKLVG